MGLGTKQMVVRLEKAGRYEIVNNTLNGLHCILASATLAEPVVKRRLLPMVSQSVLLLANDDVVTRWFE